MADSTDQEMTEVQENGGAENGDAAKDDDR